MTRETSKRQLFLLPIPFKPVDHIIYGMLASCVKFEQILAYVSPEKYSYWDIATTSNLLPWDVVVRSRLTQYQWPSGGGYHKRVVHHQVLPFGTIGIKINRTAHELNVTNVLLCTSVLARGI